MSGEPGNNEVLTSNEMHESKDTIDSPQEDAEPGREKKLENKPLEGEGSKKLQEEIRKEGVPCVETAILMNKMAEDIYKNAVESGGAAEGDVVPWEKWFSANMEVDPVKVEELRKEYPHLSKLLEDSGETDFYGLRLINNPTVKYLGIEFFTDPFEERPQQRMKGNTVGLSSLEGSYTYFSGSDHPTEEDFKVHKDIVLDAEKYTTEALKKPTTVTTI